MLRLLLVAGVSVHALAPQRPGQPATALKSALAPAEAPPQAVAKADVSLAECPLTQWGERFDVSAEQARARAVPLPEFIYEITPAAIGCAADDLVAQQAWLVANKDLVAAKLSSHGAVLLKGWDLVKNPTGFREAYEAMDLSPCLDPLHAVSARPMVDKGSAVYEAVNKESRSNFFIGMHNEFVGVRAPRAAMFVCFKDADVGGEFLVADGRAVFRDLDADLMARLYAKSIRYSVMELPFFGFIDAIPIAGARDAVAGVVKGAVEAAINMKVDFDVSLRWRDAGASAYDQVRALQARAPSQPPVVLHPKTGAPTWFCNVHSHSSLLRKKREELYGAERFEGGASQINKSDMYFGDDDSLSSADLDELDATTTKHIKYVAMRPGDAILVDNYQTMHGRNVFTGVRKHAVTWFE
ncbi:hypothetical protein M885DRAFT_514714 [Pelagophyceae sp. CCMP2097]|nr:hypothetical protein M885DRAFT_514714 [Pelagophyceae sp. CCMP2097]